MLGWCIVICCLGHTKVSKMDEDICVTCKGWGWLEVFELTKAWVCFECGGTGFTKDDAHPHDADTEHLRAILGK